MHGRVKSAVQPSAAEVAAKRAQISKYAAAKDLFLQRRVSHSMDGRTAELTAKLIELNPDFYTLWALRKEMLLNNIKAQSAQYCTAHQHIFAQNHQQCLTGCALWLCTLLFAPGLIGRLSCAPLSCRWLRRV